MSEHRNGFHEPVFSLLSFESAVEKAQGRIEQRAIDVLPSKAAGIRDERSTVEHVCRVRRLRQRRKGGQWQELLEEIVDLITSLPADKAAPEVPLRANHGDNAPRNGRRAALLARFQLERSFGELKDEVMFSKLKTFPGKVSARSVEALWIGIGELTSVRNRKRFQGRGI